MKTTRKRTFLVTLSVITMFGMTAGGQVQDAVMFSMVPGDL